MLISRRIMWLPFLVLVFIVVGAWWVIPYLYSPNTHLQLSGVIVSSRTNLPVESARVIVTLVRRSLGSEYSGVLCYGLITDEDGRFSLDVRSPQHFEKVGVEASTPDDEYGFAIAAQNSLELRTKVLTGSQLRQRYLRHDGFRGTGMGATPMVFVNASWPIED